MLVLTRRIGEEIVIDGNIRIKVLVAKGDRVRLGVTAPKSVRIDRQEVHDRRSEFTPAPEVVVECVAKSAGRIHSARRRMVAVAATFSESLAKLPPLGSVIS